jgi:transposase
MRGSKEQQSPIFSYVPIEQRFAVDHPLRAIRRMVDQALSGMDAELSKMYAAGGRPSIAPERLLRAQLLMMLYSIRSERQMMEQLNYNLLYRWFVGLEMDDPVWDVTVFTKNRERLIAGDASQLLLLAVVDQARAHNLLSEEHFTVDGTLIQAWANRRSFHAKPDPPAGSGGAGKKLLRDTHESSTDAEARLYRKSAAGAAVPSYLGNIVTENRTGLVVAAMATQSSTTAEREAALAMLPRIKRKARITLGADKAYQHEAFIRELRQRAVTPHVAEHAHNPVWRNFLTDQERQGAGYVMSQKKRKLVEKVFGWMKQDRGLRQVKLRGLRKVDWMVRLAAAAHNLVRLARLIPIQAGA